VIRHSLPTPFQDEVQTLRKQLDDALDDVRRTEFKAPPFASLTHYTKFEGLDGILRTKKIWATQALGHSTDKKELRHADLAICTIANDLARDGLYTEQERAWLWSVSSHWGRNSLARNAKDQLFIACFSPVTNNAAAWQKYADYGKGYALEFEIVEETLTLRDLGLGYFLVEYSESEVKRRLRSMFVETLRVGSEYALRDPRFQLKQVRSLVGRALWLVAATTAAITKSVADIDDNELRMIALRSGAGYPVKDGPRRVEIPLRARGNQPRLKAIHIGPNAPPDAAATVDRLLVQHGYPEELRNCVARVT
jgi:hypothetical protein